MIVLNIQVTIADGKVNCSYQGNLFFLISVYAVPEKHQNPVRSSGMPQAMSPSEE
jgi:hypothetical protein